MEAIEDIVREIRYVVSEYGVKAFGPIMFCKGNLADRIEAAAKRAISSFGAVLAENAELNKCVKGACERMELGAELCAGCPYAEINWLKDENAKLKDDNAKLRAALNAVEDAKKGEME